MDPPRCSTPPPTDSGPAPPGADGTPRWGARCPLSTANLLEGLWRQVGTQIDWSVAVHPYGKPTASDWGLRQPYQAYTFQDLPKVAEFQRNMSAKYAPGSTSAPQLYLAATEQGWPGTEPRLLANYLCLTHAITTAEPKLLFATHYYFQDTGPAAYAIIPWTAGALLNDTTSPTLAAYASLKPASWRTDASNYCCATHRLGCPPLHTAVSLV